MAIDLRAAASKYAEKTPESAPRWRERTVSSSRLWEQKAKSPDTEAYWADRVRQAADNQMRLKGLQRVSAADFEAGVNAAEAIYREKVSRAGGKWGQRFAPYAAEIDRIVSTLPAKTGDVRTNVLNRVIPISEGLRRLKEGGAGSPRPMMRTTQRTTPYPF